MAATLQAQIANGAGPTNTNAETGIQFGRDDNISSTAPVPIPTSTGEKYSYLKYLFLDVTGTAATHITNRQIAWATGTTTGLYGYFKDQATYTQNNGTQGASAGNYPADINTNNTTPAGYTLMSTTLQLWDNTSVSTGSTGRNGDYVQVVGGVDSTFTGGGGAASLPSITLSYSEA